ncbi:hypothetical protein SS50377_27795 [Spironucleus salmonicida]|uniref:Uncharacterized protein n=1 Tax=Spironucleus salmonicida TaxID=348837 RepID=A0A9P8RUP1_9EUKA|nr:hypothetical protein SS50377_27795 [Spironucleus salmonicida]
MSIYYSISFFNRTRTILNQTSTLGLSKKADDTNLLISVTAHCRQDHIPQETQQSLYKNSSLSGLTVFLLHFLSTGDAFWQFTDFRMIANITCILNEWESYNTQKPSFNQNLN